MSFRIRFTEAAEADLYRLYEFMIKRDLAAAGRAIGTIKRAVHMLEEFPFSCRKANATDPTLRELVIPFGAAGYVALFRIVDNATVSVLAVRHQREDDYY